MSSRLLALNTCFISHALAHKYKVTVEPARSESRMGNGVLTKDTVAPRPMI